MGGWADGVGGGGNGQEEGVLFAWVVRTWWKEGLAEWEFDGAGEVSRGAPEAFSPLFSDEFSGSLPS